MSTKQELLRRLAQAGDASLSGQELAEWLGQPRRGAQSGGALRAEGWPSARRSRLPPRRRGRPAQRAGGARRRLPGPCHGGAAPAFAAPTCAPRTGAGRLPLLVLAHRQTGGQGRAGAEPRRQRGLHDPCSAGPAAGRRRAGAHLCGGRGRGRAVRRYAAAGFHQMGERSVLRRAQGVRHPPPRRAWAWKAARWTGRPWAWGSTSPPPPKTWGRSLPAPPLRFFPAGLPCGRAARPAPSAPSCWPCPGLRLPGGIPGPRLVLGHWLTVLEPGRDPYTARAPLPSTARAGCWWSFAGGGRRTCAAAEVRRSPCPLCAGSFPFTLSARAKTNLSHQRRFAVYSRPKPGAWPWPACAPPSPR